MRAQVFGRVVYAISEHDGITIYMPWFVTDEGHDGFVLTESMIATARQMFREPKRLAP